MTSQTLAQRLRSGQRMVGTLIASTSPVWPQAVAASGLDFVFLDTEHIPLGRAQLGWMCQAYARMGLPPLVRVPSPDPFAANMLIHASDVALFQRGLCGDLQTLRALCGQGSSAPAKPAEPQV